MSAVRVYWASAGAVLRRRSVRFKVVCFFGIVCGTYFKWSCCRWGLPVKGFIGVWWLLAVFECIGA